MLPDHPALLAFSAPDGLRTLAKRLAELRARERCRVVFTNGCFDILHPGHVDLLSRAKALGHVLVVGVNSDDSVRRLGKDALRPVNSLKARAFVLAHLDSVDFVAPFEEDTPQQIIDILLPDVLVKGGDWPVEQIVGRETVQARGGSVHSLPLLEGYSTTSLIRRIRATPDE